VQNIAGVGKPMTKVHSDEVQTQVDEEMKAALALGGANL
jgi:hypothetical protein